MGLTIGVSCSTVKSSDGAVVKCVPVKPLKKFPRYRSAAPGGLILEIKALPKKCCEFTQVQTETKFLKLKVCILFPRKQSHVVGSHHILYITHHILVESSTVICWMSPFVIF